MPVDTTAKRVESMINYLKESVARYPWWPWDWHMDALRQENKWDR